MTLAGVRENPFYQEPPGSFRESFRAFSSPSILPHSGTTPGANILIFSLPDLENRPLRVSSLQPFLAHRQGPISCIFAPPRAASGTLSSRGAQPFIRGRVLRVMLWVVHSGHSAAGRLHFAPGPTVAFFACAPGSFICGDRLRPFQPG